MTYFGKSTRNICIIATQGWAQEGKVFDIWKPVTTHYVDNQEQPHDDFKERALGKMLNIHSQ